MDFADVLSRRRMVRRYHPRPVDAVVLDRILDRARRHPTAGFTQGIHLIVITENRAAIAKAANEDEWIAKGYEPWMSAAPVLVAICADLNAYVDRYAEADKQSDATEWPVPYWWTDAGAALMLLLLAVADEGLAAGFLGAHAFVGLEDTLGLPHGVHPIGVVSVGHGAQDPIEGSRNRPRSNTIHREDW